MLERVSKLIVTHFSFVRGGLPLLLLAPPALGGGALPPAFDGGKLLAGILLAGIARGARLTILTKKNMKMKKKYHRQ